MPESLTLPDFINRPPLRPWEGGEKIPWNEPGFSRRMLREHLSQEHDWASRRGEVIDRHCALLLQRLPAPMARILDLGCGPGLYTLRLAAAGHDCVGVDFSPASVEHARQEAAKANVQTEYVEADIRTFQPQGLFDAILLTFGEINVFTRADARRILGSAFTAIRPGGFLLLESQTYDAVKNAGEAPAVWRAARQGLFSDSPHLYLEEHAWDEASATASSRYAVMDAADKDLHVYHASMCAYTSQQLEELIASAGFASCQLFRPEEWPPGEPFTGKLECRFCVRETG